MIRRLLGGFFFMAAMGVAGQDITGEWNGSLNIQQTSLRLVFHIQQTASGYNATMDSPDQGAKGIRMSHITFENPTLTIELRIAKISYSGILDGDTITGTYTQAGQSMPLRFVRSEIKAEENKPTVADPIVCYTETPIELSIKTGKLFGTLTIPKQVEKVPLVLIIAGSGPTDRDGNNPTMTCDAYKKLAHELAGYSIASIRYDKRGIAESVASVEDEADLIFDDYVNDAKKWIQLARQDNRFTQICVLGHSEGSLIGILAAAKADKLVSVAGPGRPADELLKEQLRAQPQEWQDMSFPIIDSLVMGKTVSTIDPKVMSIFRPSVQPYLISWFKYNPQTEISKLAIPTLIIQGTNDIQVTVDDAKRLSAARPGSQLLLLENMNHLFRFIDGDRQANLATYNTPEWPLADGFVKAIAAFIHQK